MFGIGFSELLVILLIAFLVLGPEKVIALSRSLGQMAADFRNKTEKAKGEVVSALDKIKSSEPSANDSDKRAGKSD
jgi:sec-independent protein translocase protein TatB